MTLILIQNATQPQKEQSQICLVYCNKFQSYNTFLGRKNEMPVLVVKLGEY